MWLQVFCGMLARIEQFADVMADSKLQLKQVFLESILLEWRLWHELYPNQHSCSMSQHYTMLKTSCHSCLALTCPWQPKGRLCLPIA